MTRIILTLFTLMFLTTPLCGDAIFIDLLGSTQAEFDGVSDSDSSSIWTDSLTSNVAQNNSFSESVLSWSWDNPTQCLSANSLLTAEKTVNPKKGGEHAVTSQFTFTFEIDEQASIDFSGTWGFEGISGSDDLLTLSLTGDVSPAYIENTTSTAGTASDTFTYSSTLERANYKPSA
jgi:hypothetical protein